VVEGRNRSAALSTGKLYEHQWVMAFTISGGKIARSRHYYDAVDIPTRWANEATPGQPLPGKRREPRCCRA